MAAQYAPLIGLWRDASITIEKALGAEHPDTAKSLNILAILLGAQGDYAGAQPLYERALAIREKTMGADHPHTATSLANLGGLLQERGDYAGTRPLYERALAIREKTLGADHPHTAAVLNNLAARLQSQGDYAGARPLYERALAISEKAHPQTAVTRKLAGLIRAQLNNWPCQPQNLIALGKVGRNQPCPCGSEKKYKRCHGSFVSSVQISRIMHMKKTLDL